MTVTGQAGEEGRLQARVDIGGSGEANVSTGVPILDHLLVLLADRADFDVSLEVAPDSLHAADHRRHGSAVVPADEALAHVALEASSRPLLVSNVDLTDVRPGGLASDLAARFLEAFADGAGVTLHVRLIEGRDPEHVLAAIFKSLGVALALACRPRRRTR
jgi:imidazoleglycerol-phosphate dehydratase